jgi:beta-phosphoglucomutase-like phosphatase (HAD superfamily)
MCSVSFKGIIFDFNGVLWWDGHLQEQAWRQFSTEIRGWPLSEEEYAVHVHGRNNQHTLEYLAGRSVHGGELEQLSGQKEATYRQLCLDQGPGFELSPGAVELLDFLLEHQIPHTIATASGRANVEFFEKHLSLDRWFEIERIVYDDGARPGKPAPDIYHQAASNLALDPASCVVVEDSRSGIQAAHNAEIGHVIALGPASTHARLARLLGVDAVIESLDQVPVERLFLP